MSQRISLIVEDERAIRGYIAFILQREGFQTLEAEDGIQALELVRKLGSTLTLLIADFRIPKLDGMSLARSVASECPSLPVIVMSGYPFQPEHNCDCKFEFLQKPFSSAVLLAKVRQLVPGNCGSRAMWSGCA